MTLIAALALGAGQVSAQTACSDIEGLKFVEVDLADGIDPVAAPGGSTAGPQGTWTVQCPDGASPCPFPSGSLFQPLYNGEHLVQYTPSTAATGGCSYSLHVGPPGLQVELVWEWDSALGPDTVDLDLHLHRPSSTAPWGGNSGTPDDCAWDNCKAASFDPGAPNPIAPDWFDGTAPPEPVDWYESPVFEENSCYFMPQDGTVWASYGLGCHNPRLSLDNISCDPVETDPADIEYCHPETTNIDYMPHHRWTRIGVHYFSAAGQSYDVHPKVRIYCGRRLLLTLGDATAGPPGYSQEVTFTPADGGDMFWLVADVVFPADPGPGEPACEIAPLYADANRAPYYSTVTEVQQTLGPPYPGAQPVFSDGFESGDLSAWSTVLP